MSMNANLFLRNVLGGAHPRIVGAGWGVDKPLFQTHVSFSVDFFVTCITFKGRVINYLSAHATTQKIAIIKRLIYRAYNLSNSIRITNIPKHNDYPSGLTLDFLITVDE